MESASGGKKYEWMAGWGLSKMMMIIVIKRWDKMKLRIFFVLEWSEVLLLTWLAVLDYGGVCTKNEYIR